MVVDLAHVTAGAVAGVEAVVLVLAVVRLRAGVLRLRGGEERTRGGREKRWALLVSWVGAAVMMVSLEDVEARCFFSLAQTILITAKAFSKRAFSKRAKDSGRKRRARDWPEALSGAEQRQAERSRQRYAERAKVASQEIPFVVSYCCVFAAAHR